MVNRRAFTLIELVFVIVLIGILSAVALPKLAATRSSAEISKAKSTIASVRNAISSERQKRILQGNFSNIFRLTLNQAMGSPIFDFFDNNNVGNQAILVYPLTSCQSAQSKACWRETTMGTVGQNGVYTYAMPISGTVAFTLQNNQFTCNPAQNNCQLLTH